MPDEIANKADPAADATTDAAAADTPARPEWLPEPYWDAAAGQPKIQDLAKAHVELGGRFAKGKAAFADEVRAEVEASIKAKSREGLPEKPEGYELKFAAGMLPEHLTILDKPPGDDFKPEPGKAYFVLQPDNPMLGWWRDTAHRLGLSPDDFNRGIAEFAASHAPRQPTAAEIHEANAKFYAELGERGEQRVQHLWGQLKSTLGPEAAVLFDGFVEQGGRLAVEALEKLVDRAGGPRFNAGGSTPPAGITADALREMQNRPGYRDGTDKALITQVAEGFAKLFPGKSRAA